MAYYKLLIHAWFDWDPSESDLEEIRRRVVLGEGALCTVREIVTVVERPHDERQRVKLLILPTMEAIETLNRNPNDTNAILHVTC